MHIPRGFWKDGFGDIDVIVHEGVIHVFYLCISSHDAVGHLTSRDGLIWEEQVIAIGTGRPGDFDDDQIWTMGVFPHAGRFFMLYTALSTRERGKVQRVGLAVSDDLFVWTKHEGNPVICADPKYYEASHDARHRVDWRDPYVYFEDGILHGVISARINQGPENRRGAAGYFVSENGYDWQVKPALCVPGDCYDFETPALCKINNRYYLTGICGKSAETDPTAPSTFRVADAIEGPYRRVGHQDLLPGENQVFKPCKWGADTLYFHNLRGIADWSGGGNCVITALAPPKRADTDDDGALVLRPFRDWSSVADGSELLLNGKELQNIGKSVSGAWQNKGQLFQSSGGPGYEAFVSNEEHSSCILEAQLQHGGRGDFGLLIRSDEQADNCSYVALDPMLRKVQLCTLEKTNKTPSAGVTYRWRGRRVVQQWVCPWAWSNIIRLRVVLYGPYCEVSVDDRVVISAITMKNPGGRWGFFSEDAEVGVRELSFQALHPSPCVEFCG